MKRLIATVLAGTIFSACATGSVHADKKQLIAAASCNEDTSLYVIKQNSTQYVPASDQDTKKATTLVREKKEEEISCEIFGETDLFLLKIKGGNVFLERLSS